jgi:AraC family transcriptional regulator, L-rhamnose operon transcriptional activator RhaR
MESVARDRVLAGERGTVAAERHVLDGDIERHAHAFLEAVIVVAGAGLHVTAQGERTLERGDALVLGPLAWHLFARCRSLAVINLYLDSSLLERELAWALAEPHIGALLAAVPPTPDPRGVVAVRLAEPELERCGSLLQPLIDDDRRSRTARIADALLAFDVMARALARACPCEPARPPHPAALEAIRLLEERPDLPWTLGALARAVHLDRSHLVRRVRACTGLTPMAYLARLRAERAAALLLGTSDEVSAIGAAVGWPDPAHFARRFRAHFHMTPSRYRATRGYHGRPG